jgi:hypothetical protein
MGKKSSIVFSEFMTYTSEIPDAIGWNSHTSYLVECKVSRADFLRDKKKLTRKIEAVAMGAHRFYLCPEGVIKPQDLPPRWGLLYAKGRRVWPMVEAQPFDNYSREHEIAFLVSMLRRTQLRLGNRELSEWLQLKNRFEALGGVPPNASLSTIVDEAGECKST